MVTSRRPHRKFKDGRKHQDPRKKLIKEVAATRQKSIAANQEYKKAIRKAQKAGLEVNEKDIGHVFEAREHELHFYPGGVDSCNHGHSVTRLSSPLSQECLDELELKVMNGRVTYNRSRGEDRGWWNYTPERSAAD